MKARYWVARIITTTGRYGHARVAELVPSVGTERIVVPVGEDVTIGDRVTVRVKRTKPAKSGA